MVIFLAKFNTRNFIEFKFINLHLDNSGLHILEVDRIFHQNDLIILTSRNGQRTGTLGNVI